jgi:hypothetical protein
MVLFRLSANMGQKSRGATRSPQQHDDCSSRNFNGYCCLRQKICAAYKAGTRYLPYTNPFLAVAAGIRMSSSGQTCGRHGGSIHGSKKTSALTEIFGLIADFNGTSPHIR